MKTKLPPGVIFDPSRHDQPRWYYRKYGKKIRLPHLDDPQFVGSYEFAKKRIEALVENSADPLTKTWKLARRARNGNVYFMRYGSEVKIGFSLDPIARLQQLLISQAEQPTFFMFVKGSRRDEKIIHMRFESQRKNREWFSLDQELETFIAGIAKYGKLEIQNVRGTQNVPQGSEWSAHFEENI